MPIIKLVTRKALGRLTIFTIIFSFILVFIWLVCIRMPLSSYREELLPLTPGEIQLQAALKQDIQKLSEEIGEHNFSDYKNLLKVVNYLSSSLTSAGWKVNHQKYQIAKREYANLIAEMPGESRANEIIIIGAHYDSNLDSPGANDNATGAAAVLALARNFAHKKTARTLRFVEFVNEEPPFFQTADMGSLVYARKCRADGENIVAMLSLETMGYYSDRPGTQKYPFPLNFVYPSTGNFIAFIGNTKSGNLVRNAIASFRRHAQFPSEGAALPAQIPGVGWSDQWSFWQAGYPGIMVTDTAPYRYPYYHTTQDTIDKINFDRLARVVTGLEKVISDLAMVEID